MASSFFGALTQGAQFDKKRFEREIGLFKQHAGAPGSSSRTRTAAASELDFFGFDAPTPASTAKPPRKRTLSVDEVPSWAGNAPAASRKKSGSKQSRKRKLSESVAEEQKLADHERHQASLLLSPPKLDKATKRKLKKQQRRVRAASIGAYGSFEKARVRVDGNERVRVGSE